MSLSPYVAAFVDELSRRGLRYNLHAFGTNVEASLEEIQALAAWVIDHLRTTGEQRIFIDIRITTRFDRDQDILEKIRAVQDRIGGSHD